GTQYPEWSLLSMHVVPARLNDARVDAAFVLTLPKKSWEWLVPGCRNFTIGSSESRWENRHRVTNRAGLRAACIAAFDGALDAAPRPAGTRRRLELTAASTTRRRNRIAILTCHPGSADSSPHEFEGRGYVLGMTETEEYVIPEPEPKEIDEKLSMEL